MASASASPLSVPTTTTTTSSTSPRPAPSSPDPDPDPDDSDPDDPIVETYHVLLKPELPAHQQLLVLQHPNRNVDYLSGATELRLKPTSGMVELDMPLGHSASGEADGEQGAQPSAAASASASAAPAARRTAKSRAGASRATAMELD
ncbi:hypothetical protein MAPG_11383 [Magnaporthiopsis poae ATCC 64411]|uniref:Uncharacterized protein n=1 Tax=Magnaporthiopsis poae (strain ATCC 64411 / 73-15) TaxID=644358 RepID=A0A0C4EF49_MAGP6|nr:hypothetical protein MAPG_11383 [Magnaporthiopsis poae ATCC 64411]